MGKVFYLFLCPLLHPSFNVAPPYSDLLLHSSDSLSNPYLSVANLTETQVGQTHTWDTLFSTTLLLILFVSETVLASGKPFITHSNLLSLNYWISCPRCQQRILYFIFIYIYHIFGSFLFTHEPPLLDHNHLRLRSMFISQFLFLIKLTEAAELWVMACRIYVFIFALKITESCQPKVWLGQEGNL